MLCYVCYSLCARYAFGARLLLIRQNSHKRKNNSASYTAYFSFPLGQEQIKFKLKCANRLLAVRLFSKIRLVLISSSAIANHDVITPSFLAARGFAARVLTFRVQ